MKQTKDIIKEMEKEFDEFVAEHKYSTVVDPALLTEYDVKSFISKSIRTLLESFGEEICPEWIDNPYGEVSLYASGRRDERKEIRLKVKEIISSIGK